MREGDKVTGSAGVCLERGRLRKGELWCALPCGDRQGDSSGHFWSDLGHYASDLRHYASDLGHYASDLGHYASDLGHYASDLGH